MRAAYLLFLTLFSSVLAAAPERFLPTHRLMGIGVGREDMSDDLIDTRTDLMIQSLAINAVLFIASFAIFLALLRSAKHHGSLLGGGE